MYNITVTTPVLILQWSNLHRIPWTHQSGLCAGLLGTLRVPVLVTIAVGMIIEDLYRNYYFFLSQFNFIKMSHLRQTCVQLFYLTYL